MSHLWNTELVSTDWNILDLEQIGAVYPQQSQGPGSAFGLGIQFMEPDAFDEQSEFPEMFANPFPTLSQGQVFQIPAGFEDPIQQLAEVEDELEQSPLVTAGYLADDQPVKNKYLSYM
jgi:hypothetical protein